LSAHNSSENQFAIDAARITISNESSSQQRKEGGLARRRYQHGYVFLRGTREKVWIGRWLDDELRPDGSVIRHHRAEKLGTKAEFPTKRLAQRELDRRLAIVNNPTYKARPTASFSDFAERWKVQVLTKHKASSQSSMKSELKAWIKAIGPFSMKEVSCERLQAVITSWKVNPKTVRNRVATFRLLWNSAKAWQYVLHDPCEGLVLEKWDRPEQPSFSLEDVTKIIQAAPAPYDLVFWLAFETGVRRGEICALNVGHVDLPNRIIVVRDSRWNRHITANKSRKPRVFSLSPQLVERLKPYIDGRAADEPLFLSKMKKRLHPDNFVKRNLKPILKELGLSGAMHAFRHGNATVLDQLNAPMKVRQERLGHVDPKTTMGYTHLVGEDDRRIAAEMGGFFAQVCSKAKAAKEVALLSR
jgi:integrase